MICFYLKALENFIPLEKNQYHLYLSTIKIPKNTEKDPGNLMRLAVTQTSVKNRQLKLE